MKKQILLCLILTFFSMYYSAQGEIDTTKWNYEVLNGDTILFKKPSKGDLSKEQGDIKGAIKEYQKAYAIDRKDKLNLHDLAAAFSLDEKMDSAFLYLNLFFQEDSSIYDIQNSDFLYLIEDERWELIVEQQATKFQARKGKIENLQLAKELWEMGMKDQAYYYHLDLVNKQMGHYSPLSHPLWKLKTQLNDKNIERLTEIVNQNGWPKISQVGREAAQAAFLIVQHSNLKIQQKYLPLIKEAANNNEAKWTALALLIDRINLKTGKKQIYGSQVSLNDDGIYEIRDLEEPEYVNQRRKSVGLSPIEFYTEMNFGFKWIIEQKEK